MRDTSLFPRIERPDDEPVVADADLSRRPVLVPFRARALSMALRDVRANPRASWLLLALVALPVAVAVAVGLGASSLPVGEDHVTQLLGRADGVVEIYTDEIARIIDGREGEGSGVARAIAERPGVDPDDPETVAAAATAVLAERGATGVLTQVGDWRTIALDLDSPLLEGRAVLREGDFADELGEVTLSRRHAAGMGVGVGDQLIVAGRPTTVVGIVDDASQVSRAWAVLPRAAGPELTAAINERAGWIRVYFTADDPPALMRTFDSWEGFLRQWELDHALDDGFGDPFLVGIPTTVASIVAALSLAVSGLVAAAVWQTRVRRRLRRLGLLLVNGADDRQVRISVTSEAVAIGIVGAAIGVVIGLVLAALASGPVIRLAGGAEPTGLRPSLGTVVLPALLGLGGAVAAAWWPARQATRVTAQQALSGRLPSAPVRRETLVRAAAVLGLATLAVGGLNGNVHSEWTALLMALVMLAAFGAAAVLALPTIQLLGEHMPRLPSVTRLALRDAARQRGRTGAAVAVTAALLVLPVAWGITHSRNQDPLSSFLPRGEVEAPADWVPFERGTTIIAVPAVLRPAHIADPLAEGIAEIESLGGVARRVDVRDITAVLDEFASPHLRRRALVVPDGLFGDLGEEANATLASGGLVLPLWMCEEIAFGQAADGRIAPPVRADDGSVDPRGFDTIEGPFTCGARTELHWPLVGAVSQLPSVGEGVVGGLPGDAWFLWDRFADRGLDPDVVIAAQFDGIQEQWREPVLPLVIGMAISGLVALVIIGLTLMLTATETDRDLEVLNAIGAEPRLRPQVLARQAWLITTIGALLAHGLAVLGAVAGLYTLRYGIGWVTIGTVVVVAGVLPVGIAGAVRLFSRRGRVQPSVRWT